MAEVTESQGAFETRKDAGEGAQGQVRLWLRVIDLASKDEEDWRKEAQEAVERFRDEKARKGVRFNILFSQTETLSASLYNSTPVPDVRRRFGDPDPVSKTAGDVIERALSYGLDAYDFDGVMGDAVHDSLLVGRAITRVRYTPTIDGEEVYEEALCERVDWRDFRRGPATKWEDVPWIAFRHRITREQAIKLSPTIGPKVDLDWVQEKQDKDKNEVPDIFKRLTVWEIWDKEKKEVLFLAPSWKESMLRIVPDPLGLGEFWPIPQPLHDIEDTNSLTPLIPYNLYKDQAEELDRVTRRIHSLVNVLRWRGVRPANIAELDQLKDAEDGELIPSESIDSYLSLVQSGNIDNAIWLMPIDKLVVVIRELMLQRDAIKQTIFEITGVSDIQRGDTDPNETLGAQQIKAQFGSLRLQKRQKAVQNYARDLIRLKAELIAEKFSVPTLATMTGIQLPMEPQIDPQTGQPGIAWPMVEQVIRSDAMRSFRIDVETDSTIQADQVRIQANMSSYVQGLGMFLQAVGPAVESGAMPMDVASDLLTAFSRQYKLGRQAEDALERMGRQAQQPRQDPNAGERERVQAEMQIKGQELQVKSQGEAAKLQLEQAKLQADVQLRQEDMHLRAAIEQAKLEEARAARLETQDSVPEIDKIAIDVGLKREQADADRELKREQMLLDREDRQVQNAQSMEFEREKLGASEGGQALKRIEELAGNVQQLAEQIVAQSEDARKPREIKFKRDKGRIVGATVGDKVVSLNREGGRVSGATVE